MDILDTFLDHQPEPPRSTTRQASPLQEAIYEATCNTTSNLLIEAGAGCGKSTTLVEAMGYAQGESIFLAFNKSIADEMRLKVQGRGMVKTLNALGHSVVWKYRRGEIDDRRVLGYLKTLMGEGSEQYKTFGYTLKRVVGLMKNCAMGLSGEPTHDEVMSLIDSYQMDIPFDLLADMSRYALQAFQMSIRPSNTWDFDDQLYLPMLHGWDLPYYSNVFVDECQDLSPIQHLMLQRMADRGSRIIAVGDSHQAIYGFRGALTNSMKLLKERFQMTELPLSISYRCAQSIVRSAQEQNPSLQWRPGAPEGKVEWQAENCPDQELSAQDPSLFPQGQLVLCRNNAPLFSAILRHVRAKSPCRVLSNFLESFENFLRGFKVSSTSDLIPKLDHWFETEREAALKKGFKGRVAGLRDKYETAVLLAKEFKTVDEIVFTLKKLSGCTTGPVFSTVHKSKGLEAESVYILRPDVMPSPFATTEDARQQEQNLLYVAKTRAKNHLTFGISPEF